ncbi:MAG: zinc metallopeptidase [Pseudomonadota bacterium]
MAFALLALFLAALLYGPSLWVRYAMARHDETIEDMPGTGGELAEHLVQRFNLADVVVEETQANNDHFDPAAKAVRLSPRVFREKSLTALAVAAHEVGHAIQFDREEPLSRLRSRWIPPALTLRKFGILVLSSVPLIAALLKAPPLIVAVVSLGLTLQLLGALMYLIVLPEEWDASFNKALPMLKDGYLPAHHEAAVRQVLTAAAMTYFAGALADLLNVARWLVILRR